MNFKRFHLAPDRLWRRAKAGVPIEETVDCRRALTVAGRDLDRCGSLCDARGVEDIALLDAWRGGDRQAGQHLIERHYASIYRFFHGKVPASTCEDLAQRTFEILCQNRDDYRREGSLRAYLFGVARRVLFGWTRRHRQHQAADYELVAGDDPSPSGVLAGTQELRVLATALRRLSLDEQILIELKDWEGLSQSELAALFGVPQPTVARRLQRARERLRAAFDALVADPSRRGPRLRNLESCLESIRAAIDARWPRPVAEREGR